MDWMLPADHKRYDYELAFNSTEFIDWKQHNYSYQIGDYIYIYAKAPYKTIRYKAIIVGKDITGDSVIDDSIFYLNKNVHKKGLEEKHIRLKIVREYNLESLNLDKLIENGLNAAPRGPQRLSLELKKYIENIEIISQLYP